MKGIKWGIMDGGTLDLDKSVLTFMRDMGKLITIPIWQGRVAWISPLSPAKA